MSDRPPEPFRCDLEPASDHVRVVPHGEIDIATAPELDQRLRELHESGAGRVVLDLRAVTFMDSTGLRLILNWNAAAEADSLVFQVVPGPPNVQRLFEITGVLESLQLAEPDRP